MDFVQDIKEVLRTRSGCERQLAGEGGRSYQERILPYRTVNNVIDGAVVTFVDVTQLKQAEQLAQDAKRYAENIVHAVREPLLVLDAGLRVQVANKSFYKTFQVSENQTENQVIYDLGNRHWDIPELRKLLSELLPQHKTLEDFAVEREFPGIGRKAMLLNARQIETPSGGPALILLAIEDVSDRKWSKELHGLNEDLKQFAYAASHDLQEPLRMVTSYSQLLAREYNGKLDPQADQFIAFAVEGAQRMEALLAGLREYWSVYEEKIEHLIPIDGNHVLEKALDFLAVTIQEEHGIVTHDPLPTVMAEEVPLVLVFQNLIGNALKYHRPGEPPRIHVSAQPCANVWSFSVRDNGIGIEA